MLPTDATLYLPISNEILDAVLGGDEPLDKVVARLAVPQVACLIVIQSLHTTVGKRPPAPERMLEETIDIARRTGAEAFSGEALRLLEREKIRSGCGLLCDFRISLMADADVAFRNYLLPDGSWNPTFCTHYRAQVARPLQRVDLPTGQKVLTLEQSKILLEVKGSIDDHLHVQGYAGTGKSFLIKSLVKLLQDKHAETLVLAEHRRQLDALLFGTDGFEGVHSKTFGELVREMASANMADLAARRMRQTNYDPSPTPDDHLIRHLGIHASGLFTETQVVRMVRETVSAFCYSDDEELGKQHIPPRYIESDQTTRQVVLHHATQLWKAVVAPPTRDFNPRVRDHHRVKWAALERLQIPETYTHILIDECHDLAKPMLQILNRSSQQAALSLGDDYQNLEGQARRRSVSLRHREVTHSVRSGPGIEELVNPIIRAHPGASKLPFHGDPLMKTEVTYYDKPHIPDKPAAVLVSDIWGLFEWAQRMSQVLDFELLSDVQNLNVFVSDFVELYWERTVARHRELFYFANWAEVMSRYRKRGTVERVDGMLRDGYARKDWEKTFARLAARRKEATGYSLGLIEDVRNREFPSVMLAPDIVDWVRSIDDVARTTSAVYVAVTRAKRHLFVPKGLRKWTQDISST